MNASFLNRLVVLSIWSMTAFLSSATAQTNFTILKSFIGIPDGAVPFCTLVTDTNGVLYGTTIGGGLAQSGISNQGTLFAMNQDGSGYVTLKSFDGTNGGTPYAGLILSTSGSLYGTTYGGGVSNFGTVFKINRDGSDFAVLHSFTGGTDSKNPEAGLIEGSDGALYGTTDFGDSSTRGTIFKINKDGSGYAILHSFTGNPDGQQPAGKLLQGSDGALYGTAWVGGSHNVGTIFTLNEDGSGYNTIYNFRTITNDGRGPTVGVIEGSDHMLYGTTSIDGGIGYNGIVFQLNKNGSGYQILHRFSTSGGDGQNPGELMEGADGALYGVTYNGGAGSVGTIYKLNKAGSGYMILRSFFETGGDGYFPKCALLQLSSGIFLGTAGFGGVGGSGCVFALSDTPLPPRILSLSVLSNSNLLQCAATSIVQYDVQRSTNLSSWSILTTLTSQTNGQLNYSDLNPPQPAAFYRLQLH
jgi:uncharacterized repeat protein (TIGR03803 family)